MVHPLIVHGCGFVAVDAFFVQLRRFEVAVRTGAFRKSELGVFFPVLILNRHSFTLRLSGLKPTRPDRLCIDIIYVAIRVFMTLPTPREASVARAASFKSASRHVAITK
jgi:hypothetical protein